MLSYLHAFHAGNFADVFKHVVLLDVLDYLCQKEKPIRYVDTHAGAGLYPIKQKHMQQLQEYRQGVQKIWSEVEPDDPAPSVQQAPKNNEPSDLPEPIQRYIAALKNWNTSSSLKIYPGSPAFAYRQLRAQDQLHLAERHSNTFKQIKNYAENQFQSTQKATPAKKGDHPNVFTFHTDGFQHLKAALPPQKGRACVLIDPAYEIKTDYKTVVDAILEGHKRCQTATFLVWYPIVRRQQIQQFKTFFKQAKLPNTFSLEMSIKKDTPETATKGSGMTGSGFILINPPWNFAQRLRPALEFLAKTLSQEQPAFWRLNTLVDEHGKTVPGKRRS